MTAEDIYWDSCAFIAILKEEEKGVPNGRLERCLRVWEAARIGQLRIVTSSLTLVEVIKPKGGKPIDEESEEILTEMFEPDFILIRELDRETANLARRVVWRDQQDPKDAAHVATALRARCSFMHSTNGRVNRIGHLDIGDGYLPLTCTEPDWRPGRGGMEPDLFSGVES